MTSLMPMMLSADFLSCCLNAAIAALVTCTIALVLSQRVNWSLPTRHALLVAGLAASLLLPLAMPMVHLPSVWTIPVADTPDPTPPTAVARTIETIHLAEAAESPVVTSTPVTKSSTVAPTTPEPSSLQSISSVPNPVPIAPQLDLQSLTTTQWVRVCGTLLCGIWFAGIAAGIARASLGLVRLRLWSQSAGIADRPLIIAAANQAASNLGIHQQIVIYQSSLLPAPISFGPLFPRIVVPTGIESSLPPDQLIAVIQHEMAHIVRGDLWIALLQQVAAIAYWWNPLVLAANRRLADLREQICDDIAIRDLPEPSSYAATLIRLAERCSLGTQVPATLGIGSSPASQLESRIRRILSSTDPRRTRLSRWSIAGVSATAVFMTATVLLAQVRVKPTEESPAQGPPKAGQADKPADKPKPAAAAQDPTLHDLIQQMAVYERTYFPFDIQVMETFRFPDDLTPQERAQNLRADGRKHQRLMEYAQLAKQIWRSKETGLVDDEIEQGPYERFSDGERIVQRSPSSVVIDGNQTLEYYVNNRKNEMPNYLHATPLGGVFCLSTYSAGELFSEAFKNDEEAVELAWDNGDAKLSFGYGKPHWNTRYVLWLSRVHGWHPIRLQRFWDAEDKLYHDEWEVTKFVQHGTVWRVSEGTHRYRDLQGRNVVDSKIKYSLDFKILAEKYGDAVDPKQFKVEIPAGAKVRESDKPEAEPPPPAKTREITVTVVDVAGQPIPQATVRLPASQLRDHDVVTTDEQGIAKSSKAPADNVTVQITADGFRPAIWILGDVVNELRVIMTPQSPGVVLDQGKPVADVWITSQALQIRADGYAQVLSRDWYGRDDDWSGADGTFELKTNLTLRRTDAVVPLIAVNPNRNKMAIRIVKAGELGQRQELVLQNTCHVTGHCLLAEMTELVAVDVSLTTSGGHSIGLLSTRRELTNEGLRVDYQLRVPPGDYLLKSGQTSHHSGFTIPVSVPSGKAELDLGTKTVSPTGLVALKGKPAPELKFQWRPGQEESWEKLRGKVVVLDFWGTWCGPCVAGMPELMDVAAQFRDQPVKWLSVHTPNLKSFDELDREIAACQENSWNKRAFPFTTVLDSPVDGSEYSGQTSRSYGIAEWPTLVVVDQQGKVVGPVHTKKLADTITQLLDRESEK